MWVLLLHMVCFKLFVGVVWLFWLCFMFLCVVLCWRFLLNSVDLVYVMRFSFARVGCLL